MPLSTINLLKNKAHTSQPLLIAVFQFKDSLTTPSYLRVSTHNLKASDGGYAVNITGFAHTGQEFLPRILNPEIAATQALSEQGISLTPTVTLELADADKIMWNTYERGKGFKGAVLTMYHIFWEVGSNNFSTDYRPVFVGICGPGKAQESTLTVNAVSKMNMNQAYLPVVRLQKRCTWVFPDTVGMSVGDATALHQQAADDPSKDIWHCGYSVLASGGNARGNAGPDGRYSNCTYTFDDCLDRMGNRALVWPSFAPIEKDTSGRATARFGGVRWDQPSQFRSRGYGQSSSEIGYNALNEGKYNEYVPMGWGTYWMDPVILNIVGDANFTRMEVLVGMGEVQSVRKVIVNDIDVDEIATDTGTRQRQIALQLYWENLTTGGRTGKVNGTSIYDGKGDPYGSYKVIVINVPKQLSPSSSTPRIRCLVDGPKVRVYDTELTYTEEFSSCPAWVILDMLTWLGWSYDDIDIQSFIDAAEVYDTPISYNNITGLVNVAVDGITVTSVSGGGFGSVVPGSDILVNGVSKTVLAVTSSNTLTLTSSVGGAFSGVAFSADGPNIHARYKIGLGLRQRVSGSDLLRQVLNSCRSTLIPAGIDGKLQLRVEQTLADQQPTAVPGSNYGTAIRSKTADAAIAYGYPAFKFDYSNIIRRENGESSLTVDQLDTKDSPNRVSFQFYDEDNSYQQDSLSVVDANDTVRVGFQVDGTIPAIGLTNYDQAKRVSAVWLAKNFRGNPRNDTGGTYIINLETTFQASHLKLQDIVLVEYPQLAIDAGLANAADEEISGFLARVIAIKPTTNMEKIQITLQYHNDDWCVDAYEQNGFQTFAPQFRNALARPSFPWLPWATQPMVLDPLYDATNWQMGVRQLYDTSADLRPIARVNAFGKLPINSFAGNSLTPPAIGLQGTTAPTGGTVPAGRRYYAQVCAVDADGLITPGSDPVAPCVIDVPGGADTATLTVPITQWSDGTDTYELFVGTSRSVMSNQSSGAVAGPGTPAEITLTAYNEATWGIPDVEFNSIVIKGKRCNHAGVLGAGVVECTSTTITIALLTDDSLTINQFLPYTGFKYYLILIGLNNNDKPLPVVTWEITANDANTFTVAGPDPTLVDRGDGTFGLGPNDAVVVTSRPTVGSDAGGNYVEDANWVNALNRIHNPIRIVDATNASPIVITTEAPHRMGTGDKVYVSEVNGNTAANDTGYADVLSATTYAMYHDSGLTVPITGTGAYDSGGISKAQDQGMVIGQEEGRELFIAFGKGAGTSYKIKSNTNTRIYIEGEWVTEPDMTSVMFVNNPNWEFQVESASITNSKKEVEVSFSLDVPNFYQETIFLQAFTRDGGGNESLRPVSPWRIIYVYGSLAPLSDVWERRIKLEGVQIVASDILSEPYRVKLDPSEKVILTNVGITCKEGPVSGDYVLDILRSRDYGATWASIFPTGLANKGVVLAGEILSDITTFEITEIFGEDMFRVDVLQADGVVSGIDVSVKGYVTRL